MIDCNWFFYLIWQHHILLDESVLSDLVSLRRNHKADCFVECVNLNKTVNK